LPRLTAHGLLGMKFRVESERGEMTIESAPGRGTAIVAILPESSDDEAEADVASGPAPIALSA
jgi:hypothetical protein